MGMFSSSKPTPPQAAHPARPPSSPASAAQARRPAPVAPSSLPSSPPPKAGTAPASSLLLGEIRETKDKAQKAVDYLETMAVPREGEAPTQLQEMVDSLMLVLAEVQALRTEVRELRGLVSPPSRRTPA